MLEVRDRGNASVAREFSTVDLILKSTADTRAVDAFALAIIKTERQIRRLFTHLVYQCPSFGSEHEHELRNTLATSRRVYFGGFLNGIAALYRHPLENFVAGDYTRLRARVEQAFEHRNKIFHGQLTKHWLSRKDLIALVADLRLWCVAVADGATSELSYDGFARNAFQKSTIPEIYERFKRTLRDTPEYAAFIREHMER